MIQKVSQVQPIIFKKGIYQTILNVSNAEDRAGQPNAWQECGVNGVESR